DGVDEADTLAQELEAQLRRRVDEDAALRHAQERGAAVAVVAGIARCADGAVAAEHGDADRRAGAEEREATRVRVHRESLRCGRPPTFIVGPGEAACGPLPDVWRTGCVSCRVARSVASNPAAYAAGSPLTAAKSAKGRLRARLYPVEAPTMSTGILSSF